MFAVKKKKKKKSCYRLFTVLIYELTTSCDNEGFLYCINVKPNYYMRYVMLVWAKLIIDCWLKEFIMFVLYFIMYGFME